MKNHTDLFFRLLCSMLMLLIGLSDIHGVPAPRKPITIVQKDGSKITLIKYGDEFSHHSTTTDGYTVVAGSDGFIYYAELDTDGSLKASTVRANNPGARTSAERTAIGKIAKRIRPTLPSSRRMSVDRSRGERLAQRADRFRAASVTTQNEKALVLLVSFNDRDFSVTTPHQSFTNLLNQQGYSVNGATGSVRDYYSDNSNGRLELQFDVFGPYKLSRNMSYYGGNDKNGDDQRPGEMIREACQMADSEVNFDDYAINGEIANLIVIYAGYGESDTPETTEYANTIWPHEWALTSQGISLTLDGTKIDTYACSQELMYQSGTNDPITGIGVICHEFAHVLGLPDFYDTDYDENGNSFGLDVFSLMDMGSYLNESKTPPALNAVERWLSGWLEPTTISESNMYTLEMVYNDKAYRIDTPTDNEFFILENRNPAGSKWDAFLASGDESCWVGGSGKGMLVYHVDRSNNRISGRTAASLWDTWNMVNAYSSHPCLRIVMAKTIERDAWTGELNNIGKIFYPGTGNVTSLSDNTSPSMKSWAGKSTEVSISNIALSGTNVIFDVTASGTESEAGISDLAIMPNQFDATLSWSSTTAGMKKVSWTAEGDNRSISETLSQNSINISGLKPDTQYTFTVSLVASPEITVSRTVRTAQISDKPATLNMKGEYAVGEWITLSVINLQKDVERIAWFIDGEPAETTYLQLSAGNYEIHAIVTNSDRSEEHLVRYITVK